MAAGQSLPSRLLSWFGGPSPPGTRLFVKAFVGWGAAVGLIVWALSSLGSVTSRLLGLPSTLGLPPATGMLGWAMILAGTGLAVWLIKYRHPAEMIVSTYFTFVKMFKRAPASRLEGRTERLVVKGPQKYVRNPLYLGVMAIFLGWDLVTGVTGSIVGFLFILAWFRLVQIPFEERELGAIFGDQYADYAAKVPMLIPFTRRRRKEDHRP